MGSAVDTKSFADTAVFFAFSRLKSECHGNVTGFDRYWAKPWITNCQGCPPSAVPIQAGSGDLMGTRLDMTGKRCPFDHAAKSANAINATYPTAVESNATCTLIACKSLRFPTLFAYCPTLSCNLAQPSASLRCINMQKVCDPT